MKLFLMTVLGTLFAVSLTWKRQKDGSYKVVLDMGNASAESK